MNTQILEALTTEFCRLAGSRLGATYEALWYAKVLSAIAKPDANLEHWEQGKQTLKWLKIELLDWHPEIVLRRGDLLSAHQSREAVWLLLNLGKLALSSRERRDKVVRDILKLQGCRWECWRKHTEPEFLEYLARYLIDTYPERAPELELVG